MVIFFDLGGVFVPDSTEILNREIAKHIGMPETELIDKWNTSLPYLFTGKMTIRDLYSSIIWGKMDAELILMKHISIYLQFYSLDTFIIDLLNNIKKQCVTACLSNTEIEVAKVNYEKGLYKHFHHVFLSTEMGLMKPENEIFSTCAV
ncbi:MAG: hypothetical protein LWX55_16625, partial [Deltaproteobacteria bacterium]|nr:hypothetical protein [Deltaproteobacteria bacterium]